MEPLKVGLLGLGPGGRRVADALLASAWCRLVAVASQRPHRLETFSQQHPDITAYNDFRLLIVNTPLDALFVAVPPFARPHYLALAAEKGLPVWMLTPAARQLDEAIEIMEKFEARGLPLAIARGFGIEAALHDDTLGPETTGRVFLARAHALVCMPEDLDWRGDSERAGGGVLLDRAYTAMDIIVQTMGMPGSVYTAAAGVSRPGGRFPYDTEDTAAVTLQFTGGGIAQVTACWTVGPEENTIDLYGTSGSVHIDDRCVVVRDRSGTRELLRQERTPNLLSPQIEDFLSALRTSPRRIRSTLRQHLPTMAVLEAAYLSARTRQPESPGPILDMHQKPLRPVRVGE